MAINVSSFKKHIVISLSINTHANIEVLNKINSETAIVIYQVLVYVHYESVH
jgi:hypothetical protein